MLRRLWQFIRSYLGLPGMVRHLRSELDALKSHLDVADGLTEEFLEWKKSHPIPDRPLISVIILTHNRPRLLIERSIPSVLNQTYRNLELIIGGDRCSKETEMAIAKITDPRLKFFNISEREEYPSNDTLRWMVAGVPALNKALVMAQGDYISHLDDDDEYVLDRLEKLVDFAGRYRCDFVWHPFWYEDSSGKWVINDARRIAHGEVTSASVLYRSWFKKIESNVKAYRLREPADWNRYRRIQYVGPVSMRYPEPLLRHYREGSTISGVS